MYLNDSGTGRVETFSFESGQWRRSPTAARSSQGDQPGVVPDGLTVDAEGGIWVAWWGGGTVSRYAPDGSLLASLELPVQRPTSCAFGGPELATLFVTTARAGLDDAARALQPDAGRVFAIAGLGVQGAPCEPYRGWVPSTLGG